MCSQYHLEAMMRKESRSVRCEKQGVEQTSHTLSERNHRESCPLLFRRNGGELPQFYVKGAHFSGRNGGASSSPFPRTESSPFQRESKKSSFVWQDFFVRNMEGGFLTGKCIFVRQEPRSVPIQGASSPFFL